MRRIQHRGLLDAEDRTETTLTEFTRVDAFAFLFSSVDTTAAQKKFRHHSWKGYEEGRLFSSTAKNSVQAVFIKLLAKSTRNKKAPGS